MSDLIEKLRQRIREIASCPHADYRNEFYGSLGRFVCENTHEILSALETVRGIEEIVKTGWGLELVQQTDGPWLIWYGALRNDFADGPTLSAAVEAARNNQ